METPDAKYKNFTLVKFDDAPPRTLGNRRFDRRSVFRLHRKKHMGYAERLRRQFWWELWSLPWRRRLPFLWALVKHPGQFRANVARFRGQFWKWVCGVSAKE